MTKGFGVIRENTNSDIVNNCGGGAIVVVLPSSWAQGHSLV